VQSSTADTFALASRRVVLFAAVYAGLVVVVNVLTLAGSAAIRGGLADPAAVGTQAGVVLLSTMGGLIGLLCLIVVLISVVVWAVSAHRLAAGGPGLVGYGGLAVWAVLMALTFVLPYRMPTVATIVATDLALRLTGPAVLAASVLAVRARLRRETGEATLAARPPLITTDDWDASRWDPEVHRDIERRRRS
jgi:hypothetical protein